MILACHNLEKSFGDQVIVRHGSFHIEDHEKAALTGLNGAGKSTILKMITGEIPADSGDIILAKGKQLGYLSQHPMTDSTRTVYEEMQTSKQYLIDMESQIRKIDRHKRLARLECPVDQYQRKGLWTGLEIVSKS